MTSTSETLPPSADGALIETAAFEATAPSRRMPRLRAIFGAFIVGLVVALVASGAGLYAYDRVHDGQIVHGVRIAGIDVSDLGRDAAAERLRAGLASFGQGTVVVSDGVVKESLTYAALGRGPAIDTLLDQAFAIGRSGTIVDRGVDEVRTATRGVGIAPAVTVDAAAVATAVAALGNREDRAPVDAAAITTASGFATVAARPGRSVDRNAMTAAIVAALSKVDAPAQIDLALITTPVAPTVDDAAATAARNTAALMARDLTVVGSKDSRKIAGSTIRGWISFGTIDGTYVPLIAPTGIEAALKPLAKDVAQKAKDATFLVSKSGKIIGVTASVAGTALDVEATAAAVVSALQARGAGTGNLDGIVKAVVTTKQPKLTTDIAKKSAPLMRQISTWVTYYQSNATTASAPTSRSRPRPSRAPSSPRAGSSASGSPSARSAWPRATSSVGRSSAATPSRARRSAAASARPRRRCSTPRSGRASSWARARTTTTTSPATRRASTRRSSSAGRPRT